MAGQACNPGELDEVRRRIEHWRATRTKHTPMPAELWRAAADLVPTHGFYAVMRSLGLGYASLKRRLLETAGATSDPGRDCASPMFIDVGVGGWPASAACAIELEDTAGTKMRIELRSASVGELASLVEAFVNGRRP